MEVEDRIIRERECAHLTGLSRTSRWRLERAGQFPPRLQISVNGVGWNLADVLEWKANLPTANQVAPE